MSTTVLRDKIQKMQKENCWIHYPNDVSHNKQSEYITLADFNRRRTRNWTPSKFGVSFDSCGYVSGSWKLDHSSISNKNNPNIDIDGIEKVHLSTLQNLNKLVFFLSNEVLDKIDDIVVEENNSISVDFLFENSGLFLSLGKSSMNYFVRRNGETIFEKENLILDQNKSKNLQDLNITLLALIIDNTFSKLNRAILPTSWRQVIDY